MEIPSPNANDLYFLSAGGEMGKLIRAKDWNSTSLGHPIDWPQSLRIMVAMMLENPFGMYIAWGEDYIQLYNDSFRPVLGATKHPAALGISSRDTFEEIWHIIRPMFEGVKQGKAVGFPDFMVPLNRNGFIEECYFDFSYSPIRKENGEVGGVLVTVIETTAKKLAEDSVKESEKRIRTIIEGLPLVVWTAAADGGLTYISQQWEDFYGNLVNESLGNGWAKYVHPDDRDNAAALWAYSLQNGTNYETEFRVLHKGEQYRWILVRALPIRNKEGYIISWNGSNTDIHDKKLSEEAARESEQRFKAMADNIPNLAWMANADGWIYWYNRKWYEYTGTTPEQMEGWGWQSVHSKEELPKVLVTWQKSIDTGQPFEMIFPIKAADGRFRQFLTRVLPVHNSEGKIHQWFGSNTDITAQIEIEQSLKESEERFRTMAEGTDVFIAVGDASSNAIYFNKAWTDLTGRPMEELLEFGWLDLVHPEDRDRYANTYLNAFKKREPFIGEFRILNQDGDYRWLLAKGPPRFNPDGSFAGYISSSVDITDRKKAEKALEEKEQNLRNTIIQAPVAMCIFRGPDFVVELANERMFELWGKSAEQVMHKPIFEGLP
ncbi:MAG: PAS domain S-box protein, partial [Chitinophagaceae bacterium]|nr:PAS domain S-box protein [Chitinophagaceae bacterium]